MHLSDRVVVHCFVLLKFRAVPDSGFSNPAGAGFVLPNPAGAGFGRSRMFINLLYDLCHVSTCNRY